MGGTQQGVEFVGVELFPFGKHSAEGKHGHHGPGRQAEADAGDNREHPILLHPDDDHTGCNEADDGQKHQRRNARAAVDPFSELPIDTESEHQRHGGVDADLPRLLSETFDDVEGHERDNHGIADDTRQMQQKDQCRLAIAQDIHGAGESERWGVECGGCNPRL